MKTLLERIEEIVNGMPRTGNAKTITAKREEYLFKAFKKAKFNFVHMGEKPHGKVGKIVETKDSYRVYYRCGYSSYNYSPCFEIKKENRNKPTYYLLSTINSQVNGWTSFGCSNSKEELKELADKLWLNRDEYGNLDIYDETYYKNYQIVSKTKANKVFHVI